MTRDEISAAVKAGADLRGAYLRSADLSGAYLSGAYLRSADLSGAYLRNADLSGAYLRGAYLRGAYLRGADLRSADLRSADLRGADLSAAYLRGADLRSADLRSADLRSAYLSGADLRGADLPAFQIPQEGELIVYKKLVGGVVAKLRVLPKARRTASLIGRKCRAEAVRVLEGSGCSPYDVTVLYQPGKIIRPDKYDPDIRVECSHGIHFFLTREEAEAY